MNINLMLNGQPRDDVRNDGRQVLGLFGGILSTKIIHNNIVNL